MACRRKSCQKSTDEVKKFHSRSRQQQLPLTLRIPLLELLERFPNKFGMGFYPVVLNESREHSHSRLLEESGFQHGKHQASALNWMGGSGFIPASDARPRAGGERDKSVLVPLFREPFRFESMWVVPISSCV
jgi:hypothetical protein